MGLPESVLAMLRFYREGSSAERRQIADFLDAVAEDARNLVEIWQDILAKYHAGIEDPSNEKEITAELSSLLGPYLFRQDYAFWRLRKFYDELYRVVGGRSGSFFNARFIDSLGGLLQRRCLARSTVEAALERSTKSPLLLLDAEPSRDDLATVENAVLALQKEAAALEVLAKAYRASK